MNSLLITLRRLFFISFSLIAICDKVHSETFLKDGAPSIDHIVSDMGAGLPQFSQLIKELSPAVVNVSVDGEDQVASEATQPENPFMKREPNQPVRALGSGFIVSEDGYIITNNHVIEKAEKVIVRLLDDKTEYSADLIGRDPKTDLALIKIKSDKKLKTVFLGDSDILEVGDWVLAIGNQFQLGQTVTAGIVSAKSRRIPAKMSGPYDAFIQTDASINPGSSGGPLFNTKGQVIGVNTAIFSPGRMPFGGGTGFNIGIGFAIPINLVKSIVTQLKEKGKVTRGLLGVIIQRVDSDVAQILGLKSPDGALVSDIMPESPASKAGFKRKDVILSYQGSQVRDHEDLPLLVANTLIGATVSVEVFREGKIVNISATIEELKDRSPHKDSEKIKSNQIGVAVQEVTEDIARSLSMESPKGVIVSSVLPNSPAEKAGIERGDVIEEIAGEPVINIEQFNKIVDGLAKDKPILVLVHRLEGTRFLTLKLK